MTEVNVSLERVCMGLQTMCSSHARAIALPPHAGPEKRRFASPRELITARGIPQAAVEVVEVGLLLLLLLAQLLCRVVRHLLLAHQPQLLAPRAGGVEALAELASAAPERVAPRAAVRVALLHLGVDS